MFRTAAFAAALAAAPLTAAQAVVTFGITETETGIDISYSGTLSTDDLLEEVTASATGTLLRPEWGRVYHLGGSVTTWLLDSDFDHDMGDGGQTVLSGVFGTGDSFGFSFDGGRVLLPENYASGTQLSGAVTLMGATLDGLGFNEGVYVLPVGVDSVNISISSMIEGPGAEVPLPAGGALLLGAFGAFAVLRRRG